MEALRLYTSENGWFTREEARLGTIEAGKLADLAVRSADYFDAARVNDKAIKRLRSVRTVVDGRVGTIRFTERHGVTPIAVARLNFT